MSDSLPRIVIVGGGFAGLAAAKALRKTPARIILIDRSNHHLFQPLLYQVATSVLTPGQIGSPIRGVLRKQANTTVILGEVSGVTCEEGGLRFERPSRQRPSHLRLSDSGHRRNAQLFRSRRICAVCARPEKSRRCRRHPQQDPPCV